MRANDQQPVFVQRHVVKVELSFTVEVIVEALTFHPAQQSPLGRRQVTALPASNRISQLLVFVEVVEGIGPVERQRREGNRDSAFAHDYFGAQNSREWIAFDIIHMSIHISQIRRIKGTDGYPIGS